MKAHPEHEYLSRRRFLNLASKTGMLIGGTTLFSGLYSDCAHASNSLKKLLKTAPRARYWTSTAGKNVDCFACHNPTDVMPDEVDHGEVIIKCQLCAQGCLIRDGERGRCRTRISVKGELRTLVYGRPVSVHIDPIEKKPFYHFLPGSSALSMATAGCPLHCKFCQNWELSQSNPEDFEVEFIPPEQIVQATAARNVPVIAYTYNEPTVFTEYLTDIARLVKKDKLRSVLISCGFMQEAPLTEMCEVLDAIKIDLKGFSRDFYRNVCNAELDPVLRSIKQVAKSGVHLEIVNLVVPTLNDSDKMMSDLADWIFGELGPDVPVHFTRFHPDYQMLNLPPTSALTLEKARDIAMDKGIHYAFIGNVPGHSGNHTYCPSCGEIVINRSGFFVTSNNLKDGKCSNCGQVIAGVWS